MGFLTTKTSVYNKPEAGEKVMKTQENETEDTIISVQSRQFWFYVKHNTPL